MAIIEDFRQWQPDMWFDQNFLRRVTPQRLDEFIRAVRPLSAELHERVNRALFAGIKHPFHYTNATGWVRNLLRAGWETASASVDQREASMRKKLAWAPSDVVLLAYQQPTTYATTWESFLRYHRKGYIDLDTMLVCHPRSREVVLFWEGGGPRFGKRGHRELPQPRWDQGEEAEEGAEQV